MRLLESIDREARALDSRITQVMASLSASHETMLVLASDGTLAADVRPLVRLNVSVIIEHEGRREQGYAGGGGRFAYTEFLEPASAGARWSREAVRTAQVNLEAVPAPAGTMTVVLGPGWPGVLLHEAVGHGLEGDFNRKGTSAFSGRIGEQVAAHGVHGRRRRHAARAPRLAQRRRRGHADAVHDADRERRAARLPAGQAERAADGRAAPTGNGRRESFAHLTMPRMTNTYMLPGPHAPEEIIASVDEGPLLPSISAAARSTSPRASSCSRRARPT